MTVFERTMNAWRRRDTLPNIKAAGKVKPEGDRAQECLREIAPRPETPPGVRKFRNSTHPEPGTIRVLYSKANDPDIASALVHGIRTQSSVKAGPLINPPLKTRFQEKLRERQEAIYDSRQKARGSELPNGLDPVKTTFGVKLVRCERVNRKYDLKSYRTDNRKHSTQFVSKRCDDFRQRTQPQIGRVRHPIVDISKFPADHTFGSLPCPSHYGAGDVLHATPPSKFRKGQERQDTLVTAIRQQLKKNNYQNFTSLLQAFRHYDKKGQGRIDKEDLKDICHEFKLDLSADVLDKLIDYCDVDKDGLINFLEFANFLNWKDKMPISQEEQRLLTEEERPGTSPAVSLGAETQKAETEKQIEPKILAKCEDLEPVKVGGDLKTPKTLCRTRAKPERFITSSSAICATVGDRTTDDIRTYGVPSVRTDLLVPCIKRISDRTNYGEEGTAYELLFPSLYSLYRVDERHLFCPRTKNEMEQIFRNAGLDIPEPTFKEAWNSASRSHPSGEVCVESFRNFLSELQAN
ncbi:EF-hand domain-containing family member B [Bagarius yarrelli]|uniref:EF-hand domain-containing family member B n=1 Tax=Bagarius yarrelli TaxID=175774 RepID=A0A556TLU4_BAGYA|nr:EF-hand domain-containing family member B [Bagarius yarrelli]